MSDHPAERLYRLLPAIHRVLDAGQGEPLRALLGIIGEQLAEMELDVAGLYDDWFVETAAEWAVPYVGDLLGARTLHTVRGSGAFSQRALVANTLRHRRRKGTLAMLEELAGDVTGWGARAVAFFELLQWTQQLNHLRVTHAPVAYPRSPGRANPPSADRVGTVNLRSLDVVDRVGGPFDVVAHTADVRRPAQREGLHGIPNIGFFLWRLQSYPVRHAVATRSASYADGFHASPLGFPAPLFTNPEPASDRPGARTVETEVPGPIRPVAFFEHPERWYGEGADGSVAVWRGAGVAPADLDLVPVERVICKDLGDWRPPPAGMVAVDVRLGRVAFAPGESPAEGVTVMHHYGFSGDVGGGPYDRRATLSRAEAGDFTATVTKVQTEPPSADWHPTIGAALLAWDPAARPRAVITVADDSTYDEALALSLAAGRQLVLQAANRRRPVLRLRDEAGDPALLEVGGGAGEGASLVFDGLTVEGAIRVEALSLGTLVVRDCTLVPGRRLDERGRPVEPAGPGIEAAAGTDEEPANGELEVIVERSIVGPLRLPEIMRALVVRDSIVDRPRDDADPDAPRIAISGPGDRPGPPATIVRATVLGETHVRSLDASDSILAGPVRVVRRQAGCVRFCWVDDLVSVTPRRFRCQPELAVETRRNRLRVDVLPAAAARRIRGRVRPDFTSVHYGDPGYAQLHRATAEEIRAGAESGAEMGVFEHLMQPQREQNLRMRLDEYMPHGLQPGLVFVT